VDSWLSVGPIRPGRRALWDEQRGFAVGNAAGEAHPILGEGISMALQGAWLLCASLEERADELRSGGSQREAARTYERNWHDEFASRIRWAGLFAHLAMRPVARRSILPLLRAWPGLLGFAARVGGKTRRPRSRASGAETRHASEPVACAESRHVVGGAHAKVNNQR
jgi:flavin-dependent dehydrogenase